MDPDFTDLLQEFVNNLAQRQNALREHLDKKEVDQVARIIHQLRGACGGYGFPTLTETAGHLEELLQNGHSIDAIRPEIELFIESLSLATAECPKPNI